MTDNNGEALNSALASIRLDGVSMLYREGDQAVAALEDVSFSVTDGEIVSILGPSGSGKTTLINLIAGFLEPSSGHIRVTTQSAFPGKGVVVFQADGLFPWLTIEENVAYGIANDPALSTTVSERVAHYLELVELPGVRERWPRQLSGGMKKRVEFARAFASRSAILLLDEPFGSLDSLTREGMQALLRALWRRERRTIVVVTHDIEEALFLSHRVILLSESPGRIQSIVNVPFPEPRTPELKLDRAFIEMRHHIRTLLHKSPSRDQSRRLP